jgi:hypothetical protein
MAIREKRADPSIEANRKAVNVDAYNRVVAGSTLVTIQMKNTSFDVDSNYFGSEESHKLHFDRSLESCLFDAEDRSLAGFFRFTVTAKHGRKTVLKANSVYLVLYSLNFDADESAAKAFCERVGVFAAFPYFRSLVAHLSWESNTRLPPLPTIATRGAPVKALEPKGS